MSEVCTFRSEQLTILGNALRKYRKKSSTSFRYYSVHLPSVFEIFKNITDVPASLAIKIHKALQWRQPLGELVVNLDTVPESYFR